MKNFISKHATQAAYTTAESTFDKPHVALIDELKAIGNAMRYIKKSNNSGSGSGSGNDSGNNQHDYSQDYFTIIPQYTGSISINSVSNISLEYSIDDASTWTTIYDDETCSQQVEYIDVNNGDKVLFRGQIHPSAKQGSGSGSGSDSESVTFSYPCNLFNLNDDYNIEGNIMSLIYGDSFLNYSNINLNDVDGNGTTTIMFQNMFSYDTHIINAENLLLPATTLAYSCYQYMFSGCTSLTTAPALPATTLSQYCYQYMFDGCTSLTSAPATLPATTLAYYCYQSMFSSCTALTSAPALPATTLVQSCYSEMFSGCTSLTIAPELPATTLADNCYDSMFQGCTSLNYIKCLATDISATNCTYNWLNNVASTGTFVKNPNMLNWTTDKNGIPSGWTKISNSELPIAWDYTSSYPYPINSPIKPKFVNPYNLSVTFSSSDNNVATINNSGIITYIGVGTCTLTAIFDGNETYQAKTVTCTLIVTEYSYFYNYLTIESLEDNNIISWKRSNTNNIGDRTISISVDDGETWIDKTSSTSGTTLATLNTGDKLLIKGINTSYATKSGNEITWTYYSNYFNSTNNFNIKGNIMSLVYGDNFIDNINLSNRNITTFAYLFGGCKIISAENLVLPSTTLTPDCYGAMFMGCIGLTTAPVLSATTLAQYCYASMFSGCTSLTTAPSLPATTLTDHCYHGMFYNCTSLTTAPVLSATTLAQYCYADMFKGCTGLTIAPELPATTLTDHCYQDMFYGCTSLATAPELPATTLASSCYSGMFQGCTSLNYIKCLATNISASDCTYLLVYNVAETGTFVKDPSMTSWTTGINGIPSGWTVQDAS